MSKLGRIIFAALGLVVVVSSARADEAKQPKPLSRQEMKAVRGADDYIDYSALRADSIPGGGDNKRPGGWDGQANDWNRGCNPADGCRN